MARSDQSQAVRRLLACRVLGCRWRFWAEGSELHRRCERCGVEVTKRYASAGDAERYAGFLDRKPRPPVGLFGILSGTLIRERHDHERH